MTPVSDRVPVRFEQRSKMAEAAVVELAMDSTSIVMDEDSAVTVRCASCRAPVPGVHPPKESKAKIRKEAFPTFESLMTSGVIPVVEDENGDMPAWIQEKIEEVVEKTKAYLT